MIRSLEHSTLYISLNKTLRITNENPPVNTRPVNSEPMTFEPLTLEPLTFEPRT